MGAKVVANFVGCEPSGEIILTLPCLQDELVEDEAYTDKLKKLKMNASEVSMQSLTWRVVASILLPML